MNKYTLVHEHENGYSNYPFISEKSFAELQNIVGGWGNQFIVGEEDSEATALGNLCKLLDIDFEEGNCERLTLMNYDEPNFVDLTDKL